MQVTYYRVAGFLSASEKRCRSSVGNFKLYLSSTAFLLAAAPRLLRKNIS